MNNTIDLYNVVQYVGGRVLFLRVLIVLTVVLFPDQLSAKKDKFVPSTNALTSPSNYQFIENKGQVGFYGPQEDISVFFYSQTKKINYYITDSGISYCFYNLKEEHKNKFFQSIKNLINKDDNPALEEEEEDRNVQYARIDMVLQGATINKANIVAEGPSDFLQNYYYPQCPEGINNVKSYERILIKNVYPNIDWVIYNSNEKGFKYDFIVHPGGNPDNIKSNYKWARLNLQGNGSFTLKTSLGTIKEDAPISFQENTVVNSNYVLTGPNTIGYNVTNYDHSKDLVIDPVLNLYWGTYYGANTSYDGFKALCSDASDNIYVVGYTASTNFPTLNMGGGSYFNGSFVGGVDDIIILKFDANGVRLWATYYGGTTSEQPFACGIDGNNKLYIAGKTSSSDLPVLSLAGATNKATLSGSNDIFILRFTLAGVREWATYVGGTGSDYATSLAIDASNNVYITGYSDSNTSFPFVNPGGGAYFDNTFGALYKIPILKYNSAGAQVWGTFYGGAGGGSGNNRAYGIAVDASNNIYLTGSTNANDFPVLNLAGAYNKAVAVGSSDAFILKFNSASVRQWATYFGGTGNDYGYKIGVAPLGQIYVYGETASTVSFPVLNPGGSTYYVGTNTGASDGFIAQFTSACAQSWCTYYGGTSNEQWGQYQSGIAFDAGNNVYITGLTYSTDFPVLNYGGGAFYQGTNAGGSDGFMMCFDETGLRLWSTYTGTALGYDFGTACIVTTAGYFVAIGEWPNTGSAGVLDPGSGAYYQSAWSGAGGDDSYIMKFMSLVVLPVELISFEAKCNKDKVHVNWQVASQSNNNYFTIEKSFDGVHFEAIGKVQGEGNSSNTLNYFFEDNNPLQDVSYYRLRQTDYNGNNQVFPIISVQNCSELKSNVIAFNNQTGNIEIIINTEQAGSYTATLFDAQGKKISVKTFEKTSDCNKFCMDITGFNTGIYFITIDNGGAITSKKIFIN